MLCRITKKINTFALNSKAQNVGLGKTFTELRFLGS